MVLSDNTIMTKTYFGYGALFGDIVASPYEFKNRIKSRDFDLFNPVSSYTDDTVMTIATMDALIHNKPFDKAYREWGNKYDGDWYGDMFHQWLGGENYQKDPNFGKSYGNGCAMRISPIAYWNQPTYFDYSEDTRYKNVQLSVSSSHNHPESYKAAKLLVHCYALVRAKAPNNLISAMLKNTYGEVKIQPFKRFSALAVDTVPVAIQCYLESKDIEDCIRLVVSLGGDCDTIGAMACEFYAAKGEMPKEYADYVESKIEPDMLAILQKFNKVVNDTGLDVQTS